MYILDGGTSSLPIISGDLRYIIHISPGVAEYCLSLDLRSNFCLFVFRHRNNSQLYTLLSPVSINY